jgi:hypothetical protein
MNQTGMRCVAFAVAALSFIRAADAGLIFSDSIFIFAPDGTPYGGSVSEGDEIEFGSPAAGFTSVLGDPGFAIANPAQWGNYTTLLEPDGTVSDYFGVIRVSTADPYYVLGFSSDPYASTNYGTFGDPLQFVNPQWDGAPIILNEGNGIFDMTSYLLPSLQDEGWTAQFISDVEPVPEPSTLVSSSILFGMGGVGLVYRRFKKTVTAV